MPTTHQPATKQPSTQPPPHPLCDNFKCVIHYPLFDGVQVVADKKKGAYLVIGISGEAELLSPPAPGCRNSRVIRVQLTGWPKKGAIDDLEGKILYRIIKSYCNHSELATLQIMCAWAYIKHPRCSSSHNSLRGIAHSIHSPRILLSSSFAVSYSVLP